MTDPTLPHTGGHDDEAVAAALLRMLDGDLSTSETAALNRRIVADPQFAAAFAEASIQLALAEQVVGAGEVVDVLPDDDATPIAFPTPRRSHGRRFVGLAVAAALLLAGAVAAIVVLTGGDPTPVDPKDPQRPDRPTYARPIATVIEATGPLFVGDDIGVPGRDYAGDLVTLESGMAEFQIASGTNVQLNGRTYLTLHDEMLSSLTRGSATFTVPGSAVGYTVRAPHGVRYVDRGTRFRVDVEEATGASRIVVLEGRVDMLVPGREPVELVGGQTAGYRADDALADNPATVIASALTGDQIGSKAFGGFSGEPRQLTEGDGAVRLALVETRTGEGGTAIDFVYRVRHADTGADFGFTVRAEGLAEGKPAELSVGKRGWITNAHNGSRQDIDAGEIVRLRITDVQVHSIGHDVEARGFTRIALNNTGNINARGDVFVAETAASLATWSGADGNNGHRVVELSDVHDAIDVTPSAISAKLAGFEATFVVRATDASQPQSIDPSAGDADPTTQAPGARP